MIDFSQVYVNGVNINKLKTVKYCETFEPTFLGRVRVDYGQKIRLFTRNYISDAKAKPLRFRTNAAVLNYMQANGWQLAHFRVDDSTKFYLIFIKK